MYILLFYLFEGYCNENLAGDWSDWLQSPLTINRIMKPSLPELLCKQRAGLRDTTTRKYIYVYMYVMYPYNIAYVYININIYMYVCMYACMHARM